MQTNKYDFVDQMARCIKTKPEDSISIIFISDFFYDSLSKIYEKEFKLNKKREEKIKRRINRMIKLANVFERKKQDIKICDIFEIEFEIFDVEYIRYRDSFFNSIINYFKSLGQIKTMKDVENMYLNMINEVQNMPMNAIQRKRKQNNNKKTQIPKKKIKTKK